MGSLTASSTATTNRLWWAVGIRDARVFRLPLGLAGLVCYTAAGQREDVIGSAITTAVIYFIVSMSV